MRVRVAIGVALAFVLALLPRVRATVRAISGLFPISPDEIVFVDLEWTLWMRAIFVAAHVYVFWWVLAKRRRATTATLDVVTLAVVGELAAIYLLTLRFWLGGVDVTLY